MSGDFTKLQNIFSMLSPADLLASQKLSLGDPNNYETMSRKLIRLLIESSAGGTFTVSSLKKQLEDYRSNSSSADDKKAFDRLVNFYSTRGNISGVTYPYMYRDTAGKPANDVTLDQITGMKNVPGLDRDAERDMCVILSNSAFITPQARDAQKVELFLNFMPPTVISRCVPYLEMEFVFDRGETSDDKTVKTPGLLKFLLGADKVSGDPSDPNSIMYGSRTWNDGDSVKTSAGMEMFTSPQTLVNMDKTKSGSRYADVLDPTRPFATLESVTVNVTSTVGIMSYKHATAIIKLHDRSRLGELADLIQPTTYTRSTVWITYGWRHPYEPSGAKDAETYADFINNNMMSREAYGVKNSGFAFDSSGQVTLTLELFTKSVSELRDVKVNDSLFKGLSNRISTIASDISDLRRRLRLDPPSGISKEIRGYQVLDAAENGNFPDYKPAEVLDAIKSLEKTLRDRGNVSAADVDELTKRLKELYAPAGKDKTKQDLFSFKEQSLTLASEYVKSKFKELSSGPDPFIMFPNKNDKMKSETGLTVNHPMLEELKSYSKETDNPDLKKLGLSHSTVSFGKLFSVFMAPALFSVRSIDEFQVLFYALNDRCGRASSINIAEFPIDLPVFLLQYKEVIERRGSETLTVEEFVKLAVDAQISDIRAIPYGLRSQGVFKPWDIKNRDPASAPGKQSSLYESKLANINGSRGSFVMPQVEVYVETTHARFSDDSADAGPVDLLRYYEQPGSTVGSTISASVAQKAGFSNLKKIVRIHIYDKTVNPYKAAARILQSDSPSGVSYIEVDQDEFVKGRTQDLVKVTDVAGGVAFELNGNINGPWLKTSVEPAASTVAKFIGLHVDSNVDYQSAKHLVSKMVPSIIYGMNGSAVLEASLSTKQDANLTAAQLVGLNAGRKPAATPAGGGIGGLPLKVIPAALTLRTLGCPLLTYAQLFFVDFNTGTTLDNIYGISGLTHTLTPGKFDSSLTMAFYDAYGRYEGATQIVSQLQNIKPLT